MLDVSVVSGKAANSLARSFIANVARSPLQLVQSWRSMVLILDGNAEHDVRA